MQKMTLLKIIDSVSSMLKEIAFSDDSPSVHPLERYAVCNFILHFLSPLCSSLSLKMSQKLSIWIFHYSMKIGKTLYSDFEGKKSNTKAVLEGVEGKQIFPNSETASLHSFEVSIWISQAIIIPWSINSFDVLELEHLTATSQGS